MQAAMCSCDGCQNMITEVHLCNFTVIWKERPVCFICIKQKLLELRTPSAHQIQDCDPFDILKVSFTQSLNVIGLRWTYSLIFQRNLLLSQGTASAKEWALSRPSESKS